MLSGLPVSSPSLLLSIQACEVSGNSLASQFWGTWAGRVPLFIHAADVAGLKADGVKDDSEVARGD